MGKILVIKGANFAANAVGSVEIPVDSNIGSGEIVTFTNGINTLGGSPDSQSIIGLPSRVEERNTPANGYLRELNVGINNEEYYILVGILDQNDVLIQRESYKVTGHVAGTTDVIDNFLVKKGEIILVSGKDRVDYTSKLLGMLYSSSNGVVGVCHCSKTENKIIDRNDTMFGCIFNYKIQY